MSFRKVIPVFFVYAVLAISCEGAMARTIYVDNTLATNCTTSNYSIDSRACSGVDGLSYKSIQEALDAMQVGDEIVLRGGTYQEGHIRINYKKSGISWSPGQFNTLRSYDGEWAILDGQNGGGSGGTNGLRVGADQNSACVLGLTTADTAGTYDLKYWKFERLEIKNGSSADGSTGVGFAGNGGPFIFRYVYIHDNLALSGSSNPGGLQGQVWKDSLVEYSVFERNGCSLDNHNCADINIFSDYKPDTIAQFGYNDSGHSIMRNEFRYNIFVGSPVGIKYKQDQFLTGRNPAGGYPLTDTFKHYGDKVHHNIFQGNISCGIDARQDFIQLYNNIFDSSHSAIFVGEGDTRSIYKAVVYNNTILSPVANGIWRVHQDSYTFQPVEYYGYDFNNILDSVNDGWNWSDIALGAIKFTTRSPNFSNYVSDRNYFYRPGKANIKDLNGTFVECFGTDRLTVADMEARYPGTNLFREEFNQNSPLYKGETGTEKYKTVANHLVEGALTVADGGRGGIHPYLPNVQIPSYIGAANPAMDSGKNWDPTQPAPDDAGWVDYVSKLKFTLIPPSLLNINIK